MGHPERWSNYYDKKTGIGSFGSSSWAYLRVLERLSDQVDFLSQERPCNFLLGGFCHANWTTGEFFKFCKDIHNNRSDKIFYLDQNNDPLYKTPKGCFPVRAKLEALPFKDDFFDLMILDFTAEFMNDRQIADFAARLPSVLTKNGVAIVSFCESLPTGFGKKISGLKRKFFNQVDCFPRNYNDFFNLFSGCKPVLPANCETINGNLFDLVAFSRQDSDYLQQLSKSSFYGDYPVGSGEIGRFFAGELVY